MLTDVFTKHLKTYIFSTNRKIKNKALFRRIDGILYCG